MSNKVTKSRLGIKELVNIGIFAAVYFVIFFIAASTGTVPIMTVLYPVLSAILAGIPMILFFAKVNKFGMLTLLCLLSGLINFAMGFGLQSIPVALLCGLAADLILKAGGYKSFRHMLFAYIVFSEWVVGTMLPMWTMTESYFAIARRIQGQEFVDKTLKFITGWMLPVVIILIAIGAAIGALIGKRVLLKHFKRAGIA
ncbi:MAG: MptD family putative ECF transporter S component [Lachnospiraceae bacterium]